MLIFVLIIYFFNFLENLFIKLIAYYVLLDYILHLSSNETQYTRVINKYYGNYDKIYLVHIDESQLDNLKYEKISNSDIYPHQYGTIDIKSIIKTVIIKKSL